MGIRIKSINVKNLGPIPQLTWDLGNINLIFGDNEKGKSYLVEFLIRSLFKAPGWNLRSKLGSGRVKIEGLVGGVTDFSPSTSRKLEDFLSKKYIGLPPDFAKLLVFRATNVELGEKSESDKIMLRKYLSHKDILDRIEEAIPKTISEWSIDGYNINGDRRDRLIKNRKNLEQDLHRIDQLFTDVQNKFLGGEMKRLKDREEELKGSYDELEKAKRYTAHEISKRKRELEEKANQINEEEINRVLEEVNQLQRDKGKHKQDERKLNSLKESTKHYNWLAGAIEEFKGYNLEEIKLQPKRLFLISLIAMAVITGILIVLGFKWGALITLVISAVSGFLYKREYSNFVAQHGKREELVNLKEDYRQKFMEELSNLAVMTGRKESMQEDYSTKGVLERQLGRDAEDIRNKESEAGQKIAELFGERVEIDRWKERIKSEQRRKGELKEEIRNKERELDRLQVEERDYLVSKPEVEFDWDEYKEVNKELEEVRSEIKEKEQDLNRLKQSICEHTGDDFFTIDRMKLIENLADKRKEALSEYQGLTAGIIANKYISDVIEELYEEEDEKIKEVLNSEVIEKTLPKVTTHYNSISLENDRLIVSDPFHDFPVSEISDGAREQVFWALRVGMAMHWFKKDGLFLILDDAFLHSDDKRRTELVAKVLELGENGWQILCFTFDDRIKQLFDKHGGKYQFIDLNTY